MPISCHFQHYKTLLVAGWVSFAESYVKLQYFVTILSLHYKVACVHTAGEADGFNIHCSALFAAATCRIWRKFVNKFQSYIQKTIGLLFCGHGVKSCYETLAFQLGLYISDFGQVGCYHIVRLTITYFRFRMYIQRPATCVVALTLAAKFTQSFLPLLNALAAFSVYTLGWIAFLRQLRWYV